MCATEAMNLQRGMNFGRGRRTSVILMSLRPGAPYADRVEDGGLTLIYEGHDAPRTRGGPDPKMIDQPATTPTGSLTENGLFRRAAREYEAGAQTAERVRVYEKIRPNIWVYNGTFRLVRCWCENDGQRQVFKFQLELTDETGDATANASPQADLGHDRLIPSAVKLEVWRRDKGRCVECGSDDNLHFDHVIPFSRGGSSLTAQNVQLLCARHNLAKRAKIQ